MDICITSEESMNTWAWHYRRFDQIFTFLRQYCIIERLGGAGSLQPLSQSRCGHHWLWSQSHRRPGSQAPMSRSSSGSDTSLVQCQQSHGKYLQWRKIFIIGSEWQRTGEILTSGCVFVDIVSICSALCQWLQNVTKYIYWCSVTLYWIVHEKKTMDPYSTFECERSWPFLAHLPYFLGIQWTDLTQI